MVIAGFPAHPIAIDEKAAIDAFEVFLDVIAVRRKAHQ
jgi:hypothetical protein